MKQLLELNFENRYIDYLRKKDFIKDEQLKNSFISLLREKNIQKRLELWKNFKVSVSSISQLPKLANPYFMGFGNPDADILFIGREKAFNTYNNPELFFHESINNTLQWELINSGTNFSNEIFDPRNPRKYHKFKIKANHTWGKYAKIVALKNSLKQDFLSIPDNLQPTFFDYCFLSEINHLPSKYSVGEGLIDERKELLQSPFYKKFKNVIIGAKGYLSNQQIEDIFDVTPDPNPIILGKKGKIKIQNIQVTIFRNEQQQVIYCSQLSGATGWTNEAIKALAGLLK
jgi:hypothetical protein